MDITGGKLFSLLKPFEEEEEELVVVTSTCTLHYVFIMIHRCCMHAPSSVFVVTYTFLSTTDCSSSCYLYNNVKYFLVPLLLFCFTEKDMSSKLLQDKPLYGMQIPVLIKYASFLDSFISLKLES